MIVNPDHMSQEAVDQTLTLLEKRGYSGVISPHGWMDPGNWPRMWKLGGLAFPGALERRPVRQGVGAVPARSPRRSSSGGATAPTSAGSPRSPAPGGAHLPVQGPRRPPSPSTARSPGSAPSTTRRRASPHYGLYADWFADLKRVGGDKLAEDLWDGAEAYLQMWERADGRQDAPACAPASRARAPEARRELDERPRAAPAQPQQRGRAWSWCVQGSAIPARQTSPCSGTTGAWRWSAAPPRAAGRLKVRPSAAGSAARRGS